jgi:polyisoprenoid-binding protein YceI
MRRHNFPGKLAMLRSLLLLLALVPAPGVAAPWTLDPETSVTADVGWQGRTVPVRFPGLTGEIDFDEAHPERTRATIRVPSGEATTGVAVVDQLLRSRDYLGAAQYPTITFELEALRQTSKSTAEVEGRVTLRGVTKPLNLTAEVLRYGPAADDPSRFEAGFALSGEIDRTAFGSNGGVPEVAAVLPVRIRLLMSSK